MQRVRNFGWWVAALGVFGLVIPFIGPLFNFGMGPEPAFAITTGRILRHVLPGLVVIIGGGLMLTRKIEFERLGAILAVVGGAVLAAAPLIFGNESAMQFARRFVYHWGTGLALVILATYSWGRLSAAREAAPSDDLRVGRDTRQPVG